MIRSLALAAFTIALFTGCAEHYVMRLSNGERVTTANKPRLDHGFYTFKDAQGHLHRESAGRVVEIAPASMEQDQRSKFRTASP